MYEKENVYFFIVRTKKKYILTFASYVVSSNLSLHSDNSSKRREGKRKKRMCGVNKSWEKNNKSGVVKMGNAIQLSKT